MDKNEILAFKKVLAALGNQDIDGDIEILVTELQDRLYSYCGKVLCDSDDYSVELGTAVVLASNKRGNRNAIFDTVEQPFQTIIN